MLRISSINPSQPSFQPNSNSVDEINARLASRAKALASFPTGSKPDPTLLKQFLDSALMDLNQLTTLNTPQKKLEHVNKLLAQHKVQHHVLKALVQHFQTLLGAQYATVTKSLSRDSKEKDLQLVDLLIFDGLQKFAEEINTLEATNKPAAQAKRTDLQKLLRKHADSLRAVMASNGQSDNQPLLSALIKAFKLDNSTSTDNLEELLNHPETSAVLAQLISNGEDLGTTAVFKDNITPSLAKLGTDAQCFFVDQLITQSLSATKNENNIIKLLEKISEGNDFSGAAQSKALIALLQHNLAKTLPTSSEITYIVTTTLTLLQKFPIYESTVETLLIEKLRDNPALIQDIEKELQTHISGITDPAQLLGASRLTRLLSHTIPQLNSARDLLKLQGQLPIALKQHASLTDTQKHWINQYNQLIRCKTEDHCVAFPINDIMEGLISIHKQLPDTPSDKQLSTLKAELLRIKTIWEDKEFDPVSAFTAAIETVRSSSKSTSKKGGTTSSDFLNLSAFSTQKGKKTTLITKEQLATLEKLNDLVRQYDNGTALDPKSVESTVAKLTKNRSGFLAAETINFLKEYSSEKQNQESLRLLQQTSSHKLQETVLGTAQTLGSTDEVKKALVLWNRLLITATEHNQQDFIAQLNDQTKGILKQLTEWSKEGACPTEADINGFFNTIITTDASFLDVVVKACHGFISDNLDTRFDLETAFKLEDMGVYTTLSYFDRAGRSTHPVPVLLTSTDILHLVHHLKTNPEETDGSGNLTAYGKTVRKDRDANIFTSLKQLFSQPATPEILSALGQLRGVLSRHYWGTSSMSAIQRLEDQYSKELQSKAEKADADKLKAKGLTEDSKAIQKQREVRKQTIVPVLIALSVTEVLPDELKPVLELLKQNKELSEPQTWILNKYISKSNPPRFTELLFKNISVHLTSLSRETRQLLNAGTDIPELATKITLLAQFAKTVLSSGLLTDSQRNIFSQHLSASVDQIVPVFEHQILANGERVGVDKSTSHLDPNIRTIFYVLTGLKTHLTDLSAAVQVTKGSDEVLKALQAGHTTLAQIATLNAHYEATAATLSSHQKTTDVKIGAITAQTTLDSSGNITFTDTSSGIRTVNVRQLKVTLSSETYVFSHMDDTDSSTRTLTLRNSNPTKTDSQILTFDKASSAWLGTHTDEVLDKTTVDAIDQNSNTEKLETLSYAGSQLTLNGNTATRTLKIDGVTYTFSNPATVKADGITILSATENDKTLTLSFDSLTGDFLNAVVSTRSVANPTEKVSSGIAETDFQSLSFDDSTGLISGQKRLTYSGSEFVITGNIVKDSSGNFLVNLVNTTNSKNILRLTFDKSTKNCSETLNFMNREITVATERVTPDTASETTFDQLALSGDKISGQDKLTFNTREYTVKLTNTTIYPNHDYCRLQSDDGCLLHLLFDKTTHLCTDAEINVATNIFGDAKVTPGIETELEHLTYQSGQISGQTKLTHSNGQVYTLEPKLTQVSATGDTTCLLHRADKKGHLLLRFDSAGNFSTAEEHIQPVLEVQQTTPADLSKTKLNVESLLKAKLSSDGTLLVSIGGKSVSVDPSTLTLTEGGQTFGNARYDAANHTLTFTNTKNPDQTLVVYFDKNTSQFAGTHTTTDFSKKTGDVVTGTIKSLTELTFDGTDLAFSTDPDATHKAKEITIDGKKYTGLKQTNNPDRTTTVTLTESDKLLTLIFGADKKLISAQQTTLPENIATKSTDSGSSVKASTRFDALLLSDLTLGDTITYDSKVYTIQAPVVEGPNTVVNMVSDTGFIKLTFATSGPTFSSATLTTFPTINDIPASHLESRIDALRTQLSILEASFDKTRESYTDAWDTVRRMTDRLCDILSAAPTPMNIHYALQFIAQFQSVAPSEIDYKELLSKINSFNTAATLAAIASSHASTDPAVLSNFGSPTGLSSDKTTLTFKIDVPKMPSSQASFRLDELQLQLSGTPDLYKFATTTTDASGKSVVTFAKTGSADTIVLHFHANGAFEKAVDGSNKDIKSKYLTMLSSKSVISQKAASLQMTEGARNTALASLSVFELLVSGQLFTAAGSATPSEVSSVERVLRPGSQKSDQDTALAATKNTFGTAATTLLTTNSMETPVQAGITVEKSQRDVAFLHLFTMKMFEAIHTGLLTNPFGLHLDLLKEDLQRKYPSLHINALTTDEFVGICLYLQDVKDLKTEFEKPYLHAVADNIAKILHQRVPQLADQVKGQTQTLSFTDTFSQALQTETTSGTFASTGVTIDVTNAQYASVLGKPFDDLTRKTLTQTAETQMALEDITKFATKSNPENYVIVIDGQAYTVTARQTSGPVTTVTLGYLIMDMSDPKKEKVSPLTLVIHSGYPNIVRFTKGTDTKRVPAYNVKFADRITWEDTHAPDPAQSQQMSKTLKSYTANIIGNYDAANGRLPITVRDIVNDVKLLQRIQKEGKLRITSTAFKTIVTHAVTLLKKSTPTIDDIRNAAELLELLASIDQNNTALVNERNTLRKEIAAQIASKPFSTELVDCIEFMFSLIKEGAKFKADTTIKDYLEGLIGDTAGGLKLQDVAKEKTNHLSVANLLSLLVGTSDMDSFIAPLGKKLQALVLNGTGTPAPATPVQFSALDPAVAGQETEIITGLAILNAIPVEARDPIPFITAIGSMIKKLSGNQLTIPLQALFWSMGTTAETNLATAKPDVALAFMTQIAEIANFTGQTQTNIVTFLNKFDPINQKHFKKHPAFHLLIARTIATIEATAPSAPIGFDQLKIDFGIEDPADIACSVINILSLTPATLDTTYNGEVQFELSVISTIPGNLFNQHPATRVLTLIDQLDLNHFDKAKDGNVPQNFTDIDTLAFLNTIKPLLALMVKAPGIYGDHTSGVYQLLDKLKTDFDTNSMKEEFEKLQAECLVNHINSANLSKEQLADIIQAAKDDLDDPGTVLTAAFAELTDLANHNSTQNKTTADDFRTFLINHLGDDPQYATVLKQFVERRLAHLKTDFDTNKAEIIEYFDAINALAQFPQLLTDTVVDIILQLKNAGEIQIDNQIILDYLNLTVGLSTINQNNLADLLTLNHPLLQGEYRIPTLVFLAYHVSGIDARTQRILEGDATVFDAIIDAPHTNFKDLQDATFELHKDTIVKLGEFLDTIGPKHIKIELDKLQARTDISATEKQRLKGELLDTGKGIAKAITGISWVVILKEVLSATNPKNYLRDNSLSTKLLKFLETNLEGFKDGISPVIVYAQTCLSEAMLETDFDKVITTVRDSQSDKTFKVVSGYDGSTQMWLYTEMSTHEFLAIVDTFKVTNYAEYQNLLGIALEKQEIDIAPEQILLTLKLDRNDPTTQVKIQVFQILSSIMLSELTKRLLIEMQRCVDQEFSEEHVAFYQKLHDFSERKRAIFPKIEDQIRSVSAAQLCLRIINPEITSLDTKAFPKAKLLSKIVQKTANNLQEIAGEPYIEMPTKLVSVLCEDTLIYTPGFTSPHLMDDGLKGQAEEADSAIAGQSFTLLDTNKGNSAQALKELNQFTAHRLRHLNRNLDDFATNKAEIITYLGHIKDTDGLLTVDTLKAVHHVLSSHKDDGDIVAAVTALLLQELGSPAEYTTPNSTDVFKELIRLYRTIPIANMPPQLAEAAYTFCNTGDGNKPHQNNIDALLDASLHQLSRLDDSQAFQWLFALSIDFKAANAGTANRTEIIKNAIGKIQNFNVNTVNRLILFIEEKATLNDQHDLLTDIMKRPHVADRIMTDFHLLLADNGIQNFGAVRATSLFKILLMTNTAPTQQLLDSIRDNFDNFNDDMKNACSAYMFRTIGMNNPPDIQKQLFNVLKLKVTGHPARILGISQAITSATNQVSNEIVAIMLLSRFLELPEAQFDADIVSIIKDLLPYLKEENRRIICNTLLNKVQDLISSANANKKVICLAIHDSIGLTTYTFPGLQGHLVIPQTLLNSIAPGIGQPNYQDAQTKRVRWEQLLQQIDAL